MATIKKKRKDGRGGARKGTGPKLENGVHKESLTIYIDPKIRTAFKNKYGRKTSATIQILMTEKLSEENLAQPLK